MARTDGAALFGARTPEHALHVTRVYELIDRCAGRMAAMVPGSIPWKAMEADVFSLREGLRAMGLEYRLRPAVQQLALTRSPSIFPFLFDTDVAGFYMVRFLEYCPLDMLHVFL